MKIAESPATGTIVARAGGSFLRPAGSGCDKSEGRVEVLLEYMGWFGYE